MQKAKEAKTVGILVGTLGAADYLGAIQRIKTVIKAAGKKVGIPKFPVRHEIQ